MNLRTIVSSLALFSILSTLMGGYFYYSALRNAALQHAYSEAEILVQHTMDIIDSQLEEQQKAARLLAAFDETKMAVSSTDMSVLDKANAVLDKFQRDLQLEVCYLMDLNGSTIASSNRNAPDSFLGKNYAFRPYFQNAKKGGLTTYMALGVTSGRRGIYYSHPIYTDDRVNPSGVAVMKASINEIEKDLSNPYDGILMLTDPQGVIFISNRPDFNYHLLWQVSPGERLKIAESQQFGKGPLELIGMERDGESEVIDRSGNRYHLHQRKLNNYRGWKVVYLHDYTKVLASFISPFMRESGYIIVSICLLAGIFVLYLYKKASSDIILREELRVQSLTDELTGLYNRRGFYNLIQHQLKSMKRSKMEYFLLYVDLDGLKHINDKFGHHEGDRAIREIAHILRETSRESDIIARLGGDEFVVFVEGNSSDSSPFIIDRLNQKIEIRNANSNTTYGISISTGLSQFGPDSTSSVDEMLRQAEFLMYKQKRQKRGRSGPAE